VQPCVAAWNTLMGTVGGPFPSHRKVCHRTYNLENTMPPVQIPSTRRHHSNPHLKFSPPERRVSSRVSISSTFCPRIPWLPKLPSFWNSLTGSNRSTCGLLPSCPHRCTLALRVPTMPLFVRTRPPYRFSQPSNTANRCYARSSVPASVTTIPSAD